MVFTNSKLATLTMLSPNHSGQRNQPITKIAIHHTAGKINAKPLSQIFMSKARKASANYNIGYDGIIALGVEEKNRAWTTNSAWCDNRAVTIEVSNSSYGGQWLVSDRCLKLLIDLCYDICKRNNIYPCTYTGDKSGTLQMHKWYANTNCPGPYLGSKFAYIAKEVTRRLDQDRSMSKKNQVLKATSQSTGELYKVNTSALNIRSGAGVEHRITGTIRDKGVYTIVETRNGWGKLKSGKGWINLGYTIKVNTASKPATVKKTNEQVAKEVLAGKWGNGADRKARLTKAGYNYSAIQAIVNKKA